MRLNLTHNPHVAIQLKCGRNAQVVDGTDYFGAPVFLLFYFQILW